MRPTLGYTNLNYLEMFWVLWTDADVVLDDLLGFSLSTICDLFFSRYRGKGLETFFDRDARAFGETTRHRNSSGCTLSAQRLSSLPAINCLKDETRSGKNLQSR